MHDSTRCCKLERALGRHRIEPASEAMRFGSVVGGQILCPAVAHWLIPELDRYLNRPTRGSNRHGMAHSIAAIVEGRVVSGGAPDRDLGRRGLLIESVGQQAVIFIGSL
jgi:hypothetical protein